MWLTHQIATNFILSSNYGMPHDYNQTRNHPLDEWTCRLGLGAGLIPDHHTTLDHWAGGCEPLGLSLLGL